MQINMNILLATFVALYTSISPVVTAEATNSEETGVSGRQLACYAGFKLCSQACIPEVADCASPVTFQPAPTSVIVVQPTIVATVTA